MIAWIHYHRGHRGSQRSTEDFKFKTLLFCFPLCTSVSSAPSAVKTIRTQGTEGFSA
jgi:hypothetical protein